MGTKIILFGEMSSGLKKQKWNCLAIMNIVMFGGKWGRLASRRTPSNRALLQEGLVHFTK
jgi:hypothetical protein